MADRAELPVTVSPELPVDSSPAAKLTAHLLDPLRHTPLCVPEQSTISYRAILSSLFTNLLQEFSSVSHTSVNNSGDRFLRELKEKLFSKWRGSKIIFNRCIVT